jgi:hypothetical protein
MSTPEAEEPTTTGSARAKPATSTQGPIDRRPSRVVILNMLADTPWPGSARPNCSAWMPPPTKQVCIKPVTS